MNCVMCGKEMDDGGTYIVRRGDQVIDTGVTWVCPVCGDEYEESDGAYKR